MKIKLPGSESILYSLGIFQTIRMTYSLYVYEGHSDNVVLVALALCGGAFFGWALSFTLANFAQKAPRIQSKRARNLSYVSGAALLVISPIIMAPATYMVMPEIKPDELKILIAICIATAPDFAAIIIAAQSGSLQSAEPSQAKPERTPAKKKQSAKVACKHGCGKPVSGINGQNAHNSACPKNPARQFVEAAKL